MLEKFDIYETCAIQAARAVNMLAGKFMVMVFIGLFGGVGSSSVAELLNVT